MQDRALQTTFDRLIKVPRAGDEKCDRFAVDLKIHVYGIQ